MQKGHFASGTVEGTGAAINVECGFTPDYVKLINIDGDATLEYTSDMTAGEGYKIIGATGVGAQMAASAGVTAYAGAEGTASAGFTIGTDTDVNAAAETIMWIAMSKD